MSVEFNIVRWKNFLSTGNNFTEFKLDNPEPVVIYGKNGDGKSTLIDAVCFCLFGKSFRKINKGQLLNSINKKNLVTEIEFQTNGKHYKIERGMKPDVFKIFENGELLDQDAANRDYQEYLESEILKFTYKSFTHASIVGKATYVPFMKLPTGNRREIIEDILDINVFSLMNVILKSKISDNKKYLNDVTNDHDVLEHKIETQSTLLEKIKKNNDDQIKNLESEIHDNENKVKNLEPRKKDYESKLETLESKLISTKKFNNEIRDFENVKRDISSNKRSIESEIKSIISINSCPTCKQDVDNDFKEDFVKSKESVLSEIEEALTEIEGEIKTLSKKVDSIEEKNEDVNKTIIEITKTLNEINNEISLCQSLITNAERKIKTLITNDDNDLNSEKDKLIEFKTKFESCKELLIELSDTKECYDICLKMLKDDGIKSTIINHFVPIINKTINSYLDAMDLFVLFELDETFSETIKSRHRDKFTYESFSEGEKARIDLAILLALRSIAKMKSTASTNILILDEVFDGSLDDVGSQQLKSIIDSLVDNNIIIITHNGELISKFKNSYRAKKVNNFSVLEENDY